MKNGWHFSMSLSRELWSDLLRSALPIEVASGEFDLVDNTRQVLKQLQVKEMVRGLLEDQSTPGALVRVGDRARGMWRDRKEDVYELLNQIIRVEGTWKVVIDDQGTELGYDVQKITADAYVKGVAEGKLYLLKENVEVPFTISQRLGAEVALKDIHFSKEHNAIIGSVGDLALHLGESAVFDMLFEMAGPLIEQQLANVNPVPILKKDQLDEMVAPAGGPLKMKMGVEDVELNITADDMSLNVRFGFTQGQITQRDS